MSVKISREFNHFNSQQSIELKRAFDAVQDDLTTLKTAFDTLVTKLNTDTAEQNAAIQAVNDAFDAAITKLNTDAGNTQLDDTDYAIADQTIGFDEDYTAAGALTLTK